MPAAPRRSSFPMTSWNAINTGALRVYPAISIGASAQGGSPQTPDNKPIGVIYRQPYTVGPPSTGGGTDQWQLRPGRPASAFTCDFRLWIGVTPPTASVIDIVRQRPLPALATHSDVEGHEPYLTLARAAIRVCFGNSPREVVMSAEVAAEETRGPGIVLQPEEGQSYWQPIWANGYSIVKLSPKHAGPDNLAMGIQVIAPGGYVREHSHTPNQEILFCFAGKGTIIVDGVPHPFVPGTTVYAAPGVRHKIINDGPDELKMTWTYLPPGLDDFFAAIGRPRQSGEPAPEPFARPADVHAIEARTGYGAPIEG